MSVYYCYTVVRPIPDDLTSLRGVAGEPVELIAVEDMAAVVSPVPADQFSESALKASLENLEWLEEVARAHNVVVDELARRTVALPSGSPRSTWTPPGFVKSCAAATIAFPARWIACRAESNGA